MTNEHGRGRLARLLLPGGEEPDPRFTLANERTFLAWIRTSLAFIAGGVALEALANEQFNAGVRQVTSMTLIGIGWSIALFAALRWRSVELSMRRSAPLPAPGLLPLVSIGALTAAALALCLALL